MKRTLTQFFWDITHTGNGNVDWWRMGIAVAGFVIGGYVGC